MPTETEDWKNPHWYGLRSWQQSKFINSTYIWIFIVPVAAKGLHKVNENLEFKILEQPIKIAFSLPFSWWMFFFSALSFWIANVIVFLFCPRIFKDHLSYAGFKGDGKGNDHLEEYAREIGKKYAKSEDEIELQDIFWAIWNASNVYRKFWRIVCAIFYVVGLLLFLLVIGENIIWVIRFTT